MSQKHSRYFSLRNLVHIVGTALNSYGSKSPIKEWDISELLSEQNIIRAESPGLFLYATAQKVASDGGNAKDLFVSPFDALKSEKFTKMQQFKCTLCDRLMSSLPVFLSHIAGKLHMKSLKNAPCGICFVPQFTILQKQVPIQKNTVLKARQAGQILCGLVSGGTEDLYSLHPDGCTAEHILENFGWISCLPCGIGFVPQRCLQDLVSHLQSDQHQQKLLLDLGLVENGHISQLSGRPRTGEAGPKKTDPECSQQELLNHGAKDSEHVAQQPEEPVAADESCPKQLLDVPDTSTVIMPESPGQLPPAEMVLPVVRSLMAVSGPVLNSPRPSEGTPQLAGRGLYFMTFSWADERGGIEWREKYTRLQWRRKESGKYMI